MGFDGHYAYNHDDTYFDHEVMFLLTSMDPIIHQLAEQHRFGEIDLTKRWPVYWFINGRAAPDDLAERLRRLAAAPALQLHAAHVAGPEVAGADPRRRLRTSTRSTCTATTTTRSPATAGCC